MERRDSPAKAVYADIMAVSTKDSSLRQKRNKESTREAGFGLRHRERRTISGWQRSGERRLNSEPSNHIQGWKKAGLRHRERQTTSGWPESGARHLNSNPSNSNTEQLPTLADLATAKAARK